jgi:secondary thiamine-phosphate synthase enzyme
VVKQLLIQSRGAGLTDFTREVAAVVTDSAIMEGLCTVFLQHTSASLIIQENADADVQRDLQNWLSRLVPEGDPLYTHTAEGPDDMPAHIKTALTSNSLSIPVMAGRLVLGTWQGIYLWEHRRHNTRRQVVVHVGN